MTLQEAGDALTEAMTLIFKVNIEALALGLSKRESGKLIEYVAGLAAIATSIAVRADDDGEKKP